eukprot:TRINITY_DN6760_c0_g1_i1.p1 TRINITY_DN6760_c0_g1~~TRINITY_DN6760_c0_g1_i1.p1  ORF type:complete len:109 (+),score=31.94 TRINITY_DN6760_c0_g1_i1:57-383(+)
MTRLLFVAVLLLFLTAVAAQEAEGQQQAAGQQQQQQQQQQGNDPQADAQKPHPIQQGLVGSPLKLRLTYHIYLFFLGVPIGTLVLSAFLFFGYIGLSKSPVDIPLQLN